MRSLIRLTIAPVSVLVYTAIASAQQPAPVSDPDAAAIAAEAYVFGYPLVTMYVTERVQTNVATPQPVGQAPANQFGSLFAYPTAAFKDVTAPNVNTLYSIVWLDLSEEPIVIHVPNTHGRYYVMEILDYWTNVFASPGKRRRGPVSRRSRYWARAVPESYHKPSIMLTAHPPTRHGSSSGSRRTVRRTTR